MPNLDKKFEFGYHWKSEPFNYKILYNFQIQETSMAFSLPLYNANP